MIKNKRDDKLSNQDIVDLKYKDDEGRNHEGNNNQDDDKDDGMDHCSRIAIRVKPIIIVIYTILLTISFGTWLFDTIHYDEQICRPCLDENDNEVEPTLTARFLYYTNWSMFLTIGTFLFWAYGPSSPTSSSLLSSSASIQQNKEKNHIAQSIVRVALPHVCFVMIGYIYLIANSPPNGSLDKDLCYTILYSSVSKNLIPPTDDDGSTPLLASIYLGCAVVTDLAVHYLSAPLLIYVVVIVKELDYDLIFPYSTIFMVVLGIIAGCVERIGVRLYCGESPWFTAGMGVLCNAIFHIIFIQENRGKLSIICKVCCSRGGSSSDNDDGKK